MEYFSGVQPDLISGKSLKDLNTTLLKPVPNIQPVWKENVSGFYNNYVAPNVFPIIMIVLVGIFLLIKYIMKNEKEHFNPSKPIKKQKNRNHYVDGKNDIHYDESEYPYMDIVDEVDYDDNDLGDGYDEKQDIYDDRQRYSGIYDQWSGQQDTSIAHPYGYDDNFVSSSADAIRMGTSENRKSIDELAKIMFGK